MTDFNSGISLWKPFETTEATKQRSALANPAATNRNKRQWIWEMMASVRTTLPLPGHGLSADEAKQYLRIHDNLPTIFRVIPKDTHPFRCPLCEQESYDTWIYDLAWIRQCPVHQRLGKKRTALRKNPNAELFNPSHLCYSSADKQAAYRRWRRAQFDPLLYFRALQPIVEVCAIDTHLIPINLYAPYPKSTYRLDHSCLYPGDEIFPDVMISLFPKTRNMIQHTHAKSRKMVKHIIPRYPSTCLSGFYSTYLNVQCYFLKEKVIKRVKNFIRATFPGAQFDCVIGSSLSQPVCIPGAAFQIWRTILNTSSTYYPWQSAPGSQLFRNFAPCIGSYLIPRPMKGFWAGRYTPHPTKLYRVKDETTLPTPLTLFVYEIDLWNLFRAILVFLLHAYIGVQCPPKPTCTMVELIETIPEWAIPGNHFGDEINVYLDDDHFIVTFPYSYIDPYCRDLKPLFEKYLQIGS